MSDFQADQQVLLSELARSRSVLTEVLGGLVRDDLSVARPGSWAISRILDHVLQSERLYTQLISVFSSKPATVQDTAPVTSPDEAITALDSSRRSFLDAVSQVQEGDFYRLQTVGHDEYSVLSILENNAAHDREHAEQIRRTVSR